MGMNVDFPSFNRTRDGKDIIPPQILLRTWHNRLKNYRPEDIKTAYEIYISKGNEYAPGHAGILTSLLADAKEKEMSEMEAWSLVSKAIKNGNYGAQAEYDRLPEDVRAAVGSPDQLRDWAKMESEAVHSVVQSNFMRSYRSVIKKRRDFMKMPENVRARINEISQRAIAGGQDVPDKDIHCVGCDDQEP